MEEHIPIEPNEDEPEKIFVAADGTVRDAQGRFVEKSLREYGKPYKKSPGRTPILNKSAKEKLNLLMKDKDIWKALKKVAKDPNHPAWARTIEFIAKYSLGLPKQTVEHEGLPTPITFLLPKNGREEIPEVEEIYVQDEVEIVEVQQKQLPSPEEDVE